MPELILLHGFAHPPTSWDAVRAELGVPARALALPGHVPKWPVAATWGATVAALAERVPRDAIVVGYSLGARLALGLLARDRAAAVVLISVNPGLADAAARAERRAADAAWADRLRAGATAEFLAAWEAQPIFATAARVDAEVRAARHAARAALEPRGLADALDVLGLGAMPDLAPALLARAARARLVVGADDGKFRQRAAELAALAPTLGPTVVDGSGHDPTLERPAALAAIIARLTRSLVTGAAGLG